MKKQITTQLAGYTVIKYDCEILKVFGKIVYSLS